jgi:hypothetical protein
LNTKSWSGTATNLLSHLAGFTPDNTRWGRDWPKSSRALSGRLRRLVTALRAVGVHLEFDKREGDKRRLILIEWVGSDEEKSGPPDEESFGGIEEEVF